MPTNSDRSNRSGPGLVSVWDPLVRIVHWALALGFLIAYASPAEEGSGPGALHVWSGYALGALVLLRLVWGFIGPRYARFSDFVFRPAAVIAYLKSLVLGHPRRYLGHSPAGGAMIVALLASLAACVATGIAADGEWGRGTISRTLGELHGLATSIALILVILHILGVVATSIVHRENLVSAMFTGKKRGEG